MQLGALGALGALVPSMPVMPAQSIGSDALEPAGATVVRTRVSVKSRDRRKVLDMVRNILARPAKGEQEIRLPGYRGYRQ